MGVRDSGTLKASHHFSGWGGEGKSVMALTCLLWVSGRDYKLKLRRWGGERNKDGLPSCGKVAAISTGSRRVLLPQFCQRSPKSEAAGGAGGLKFQPDPGQGPFFVKMGKPSWGEGGTTCPRSFASKCGADLSVQTLAWVTPSPPVTSPTPHRRQLSQLHAKFPEARPLLVL